ncbi:MAG: GNAT family N-acetyltransferase [Actinomycetota bacterium]|nr:GNAT family N-acetyltransferase [Actinomycetota bacterium]
MTDAGDGTWTYRVGEPSDADAVVALIESAYRGDPSRAGWTTEADLLAGQRTDVDAVLQVIEAPGAVMLLAFDGGGRITACCQVEDRGGSCYFGMFAVAPAAQGSGIGGGLLAEAERWALERYGAKQMEMTVIRQRQDLIAWYRRRGYQLTGATAPFPYGDERYGIPLRDDLEFVVLVRPLP